MKFSDLDFQPHPSWDGVQAKHFFNNGYGASVIKSYHSYGGPQGLYELAVLKGDAENSSICYNTSITDDVLGNLTEKMVEQLVNEIENF